MHARCADHDDYVVNGEDRTLDRGADHTLAVAVLLSAGDVREIAGLQSAKVGTLRLAVVRESFQRATRAIWTDRGGSGGARFEASAHRELPAAKTGVSLSAAAGTLRTVLRRVLDSRGLDDKKNAGVCLVLYCKFAGGIVACPLGGASFRLREGLDGARGSVGAPGVSHGAPPVRVELAVCVQSA